MMSYTLCIVDHVHHTIQVWIENYCESLRETKGKIQMCPRHDASYGVKILCAMV